MYSTPNSLIADGFATWARFVASGFRYLAHPVEMCVCKFKGKLLSKERRLNQQNPSRSSRVMGD